MNKQQKLFLNEFNSLCKKYNIDTVCMFNGSICFQSNGEYISFASYTNDYGDGTRAIFNGILTRQDDYEIIPGELIEGD